MTSQTNYEIDHDLLAGFIDEAEEGFADMENLFVQLESEPTNTEIINAIYRPIHTVKGNSAFFGLMKVKTLAHEMETILSLAKDKKLVPVQSTITVLLEGTDQLKQMLMRVRGGQDEIDNEHAFSQLISNVIAAQNAVQTDDIWDDLCTKIDSIQRKIEKTAPSCVTFLEELATYIQEAKTGHTDKGKAGDPVNPTHPDALLEIRDILNASNKQIESQYHPIILDNLNKLLRSAESDEVRLLVQTAHEECQLMIDSGCGQESLMAELLFEKVNTLMKSNDWNKPVVQKKQQAVSENQDDDSNDKQGSQSHKTIRIAERSVDEFLNYVGELIVVGEMYAHLQKTITEKVSETEISTQIKRVNESFSILSDRLLKSVMNIRKIPIKTILQKAPRIVRDVASANGKEIKVEILGQETEIDKRLIEALDGPLTHMARNAADHGIESPQDRQQAGKPSQGVIRLEASQTADSVILVVSDDGRGLDIEGISTKAEKLGLIQNGQLLTEEQLIDLLFCSGVSTAAQVSDVSGRGVGMDVVKRNIDAVNGKIKVSTQSGRGTEFKIILPKTITTQIIDGFLIGVSNQRYVLPLDKVSEVFCPDPAEVSTVTGKNQCVQRHDRLLSVVNLSEVLGIDLDTDRSDQHGVMVTVYIRKEKVALRVDTVLGVQKVVLKEISGLDVFCELYSSTALMGDGTVAMVLNLDSLNNKAERNK